MRKPLVKMGTQRFGLSVLVALLVAVTWAPMSRAASVQEGKKIFEDKCANCHGDDGSGNTVIGKAIKAADLRSADAGRKTDAEIYQQIENGKGNMPPFGSSLDKDQISDLIAYVRAFSKGHAAAKKAH
jgi:mono/diheme cytochrome c family protein